MVEMHGDERVVTPELAESLADRLRQIPVVVALDQVRNDLRVGLGGELVALGGQIAPELGVVLDDPVEDDVDLVLAVAVRMRVLLGDPAMRRPPRVAEADGRRRSRNRDGAARAGQLPLQGRAQVRQIADRAHAVDLAVRDHGDPGGVIACNELLSPAISRSRHGRSPTYPTMPHI